MKRTETISLRLDEEVTNLLRSIADLNDRKLNSVANQLLRKALELEYVPLLRSVE
jgi:predicted transcriptional regulator